MTVGTIVKVVHAWWPGVAFPGVVRSTFTGTHGGVQGTFASILCLAPDDRIIPLTHMVGSTSTRYTLEVCCS